MVAMCPTTVHVGNSTIVYLTRNQTVLIVVAEWMLEKSIEVAVNFEKELLHAKFLGLACRRKHMSKRSISVRALFPQYGKNMTKKT